MKIVKAKPDDANEIFRLRSETFNKINAKDYTKDEITELNNGSSPKKILEKMKKRDMFCLIDKKEIVGVIDLEDNKIGGLFIKSVLLRKGLGTKLLLFIEKYAKSKGIDKVILFSTKYALPFYEKHSYIISKEQIGGKSSVKMEKYIK